MGTYLGIHEDISGSKCKFFAFLKYKLMHTVNGWTCRWLSKWGKEVLIKSILLALPTYVMSSFLLPLKICENLARAIAQFWWSSNPPKRGIHWAKWKKICLNKGGRWDWFPYDPRVQPGFISKTTMEANSIPWFASGSSLEGKILQSEFAFTDSLCEQPILCVDQYFSGQEATAIGNQI